MSYCQDHGKDKVIFVAKEDHEKPSTVALPEIEDDEPRGIMLPNGEINWNCPCLGGTASGPCAYEFRAAFTCFHESKDENRGSECLEQFSAMQDCMSKYPTLYSKRSDDDGKNDLNETEEDDEISHLEKNMAAQDSNQKLPEEKPLDNEPVIHLEIAQN